ncbi:hypothetical protein B0H13DRAFT_1874246 [Mycena leptocephala]|nr:hypothetical protein B0H13DRAFT_1874246 [Mycena leptocephala]
MATTDTEERALGIPPSKIPAPFARVAGPDEGVDETSQQLGVQRRATVRRAPTAKPASKKRKANSGAAVPVASGSGSRNVGAAVLCLRRRQMPALVRIGSGDRSAAGRSDQPLA